MNPYSRVGYCTNVKAAYMEDDGSISIIGKQPLHRWPRARSIGSVQKGFLSANPRMRQYRLCPILNSQGPIRPVRDESPRQAPRLSAHVHGSKRQLHCGNSFADRNRVFRKMPRLSRTPKRNKALASDARLRTPMSTDCSVCCRRRIASEIQRRERL